MKSHEIELLTQIRALYPRLQNPECAPMLERHFEILCRFAPTLATVVDVAGAWLVTVGMKGNPGPTDLKELAKAEIAARKACDDPVREEALHEAFVAGFKTQGRNLEGEFQAWLHGAPKHDELAARVTNLLLERDHLGKALGLKSAFRDLSTEERKDVAGAIVSLVLEHR